MGKRMPVARRRLLGINAAILVLVAVINLPFGADLLDAPLGISWSSDIVLFLRTQTQGMLLLIGFSLIVEASGWTFSKADERKLRSRQSDLLQLVLDEAPDELLVRTGLVHRYGAQVDSLERIVISDRASLMNTSIFVSVEPLGSNQVVTRHELEFDWQSSEFTYCLVRNTLVLEAALSGLRSTLEFTVVDSTMTLQNFATRIDDHAQFVAISNGETNGQRERKVVLTPLSLRATSR